MKVKIKCPKCNHPWETSSELFKVTCSSCGTKVLNPNFRFKKQELKGGNKNGFRKTE